MIDSLFLEFCCFSCSTREGATVIDATEPPPPPPPIPPEPRTAVSHEPPLHHTLTSATDLPDQPLARRHSFVFRPLPPTRPVLSEHDAQRVRHETCAGTFR